jgi:hypothetical protein
MTEKCLRCESTTESHDAMFLQWHQESNFADRSCRATDERHGGIALRATGNRETDLGGGDFRPRRDLRCDMGGRGRSKRAGTISPGAGTNLAARGSGGWRARWPLQNYRAKNLGWLAWKIEEEEGESVGYVFTILIAIFRWRNEFESDGDALRTL